MTKRFWTSKGCLLRLPQCTTLLIPDHRLKDSAQIFLLTPGQEQSARIFKAPLETALQSSAWLDAAEAFCSGDKVAGVSSRGCERELGEEEQVGTEDLSGAPWNHTWASPVAQRVKHLPAMWEPQVQAWAGKIPSRRKRNPLQYACLENPTDGGAWWATVQQRIRHDWTTSHSAVESFRPCCHWVFKEIDRISPDS